MRENNCCGFCARTNWGGNPAQWHDYCENPKCPCHQAAPNTELKKALVERISDPEIIRKAAEQSAQDQNDMLAAAPNTSKGDKEDLRETFKQYVIHKGHVTSPLCLANIMAGFDNFLSQLAEEVEKRNAVMQGGSLELEAPTLAAFNHGRNDAAAIIRKYIR